MALSMEEQRILAEIEQQLAKSSPALAARLSALGQPGSRHPFASPHARRLVALVPLLTLVIATVAVYTLISVRGMSQRGVSGRGGTGPPSAAPRNPGAGLPRAQMSARSLPPGLAPLQVAGTGTTRAPAG